jgi:hypothetical protein
MATAQDINRPVDILLNLVMSSENNSAVPKYVDIRTRSMDRSLLTFQRQATPGYETKNAQIMRIVANMRAKVAERNQANSSQAQVRAAVPAGNGGDIAGNDFNAPHTPTAAIAQNGDEPTGASTECLPRGKVTMHQKKTLISEEPMTVIDEFGTRRRTITIKEVTTWTITPPRSPPRETKRKFGIMSPATTADSIKTEPSSSPETGLGSDHAGPSTPSKKAKSQADSTSAPVANNPDPNQAAPTLMVTLRNPIVAAAPAGPFRTEYFRNGNWLTVDEGLGRPIWAEGERQVPVGQGRVRRANARYM